MGFKLQLVLGVVLVFLACVAKGASSDPATSSTTPQNAALDKPDTHINLIEKSPKTDAEQKNVNSNTQKNLTSIKLNKSDPPVEPLKDEENKKVENLSNDVVEKDRSEETKENSIKKDISDKNDKSKPVDIQKYQRKNDLYTAPVSDAERYVDRVFQSKSSTEKFLDFDDFELTTPRHDFFDNRYREAVQSIDEKLEHIDNIEPDEDGDHSREVAKLTEKHITPTPNLMDITELKDVLNSSVEDKHSTHKDMVVMQVKRVNIETVFNDTEVYDDDDEKDEVENMKGAMKKMETTTPKNNFIHTTRKSVTKPPINKNNSHILSNKIETETFKAVNFVTTESPTTSKRKGDDERHMSTIEKEQTIQENQVIPLLLLTTARTTTSREVLTTAEEDLTTTEDRTRINVEVLTTAEDLTTTEDSTETTTDSEETTTDSEETTTNSEETTSGSKEIFTSSKSTEDTRTIRIEENLTPTESNIENSVETTSYEDLSTESGETTLSERPTTFGAITTDTTLLRFPGETTTWFERKSEPLIEEIITTTSKEDETTLGDQITTTSKEVSTTASKEDLNTGSGSAGTAETPLVTNIEEVSTSRSKDYERLTGTDIRTTEISLTSTDGDNSNLRTTETSTSSRDEKSEVRATEEISTPTDDDETTEIEIRTTERGYRTSKSMIFPTLSNKSETESPTETPGPEIIRTTIPAVTELIRRSTQSTQDVTDGIIDTSEETTSTGTRITEIIPHFTINGISTIKPKLTTVESPTTMEITKEILTTFRPITVKIGQDGFEGTTESPTTINKITVTLPPYTTTEDIVKETIDNSNYPTTTAKTTTTVVSFIRVATLGGNQTTLLPETLSPGANYPLPNDISKATEDDIVTTTEDGSYTAATEGAVTGETPDDKKGTIAAIVISTVGAVCLVLLAGLLYIMRKRQKRFNYGERCRPVSLDDYSVDNVSVYNSVRRKGILRVSKRSYGNPAFDDPSAVSHPLNFQALAKFAGNTEDMKAEFEEIPQISARTSELPEGCETKNRYANVIPLPETRVCLQPIEGYPNSDYINANYVTGPKNVKGYYIATQAPMLNTVDDFWRMIWEQQSKVILMVTHFFENGVEKCVDYLPPSEVLDCHRLFGDFQVTLKKREVKDKYIISCLQLKNMVSNSWREVTHFWYMGWPEKGVPSEANSLIAFLIEARSFMKTSTLDKNASNGDINNASQNEANPVVVHCSPGTGRTGVVIACDIAIREFEQTRLVDIPKIVYRIRRDRANAVQTKEQYTFIYKVVSLYATKLTGGALDSL